MRTLSIFLCVLYASVYIQCANILIVEPSFDFNHKYLYTPLWIKLAKRGHKITVLTPGSAQPNENITYIDFFREYESMFKKSRNISGEESVFPNRTPSEMDLIIGSKMADKQFKTSAFTKLLARKFDLIILELGLPYWSFLSGLFKCPLIGFSRKDASPFAHSYMGNSIHPVIYPWDDHLVAKFGLEFEDRCWSVIVTIINYISGHILTYSPEKILMSRHTGKEWPSNFAYLSKASLIFINANPIFHPPRPITPITINLGGFLNIADPRELPDDLQKYLDESKDGCIYVSFGTTVNSNYLTDEQKNVLVQVFQEMAPMRVLWKFDDADVAKDASNIEIRNWVPQQDVLRHPNVKLFFTQGGLQSMEEAIDSAVPMLGMPFYGDQFNNVVKMRRKQFGYSLHVKNMNRKSLKAALKEVLNDPKYKKNIDKYSAISKDQPMKGLEKAVWWTEYVLRHGGTEHLRSPSADIPLYQYFFLDIFLLTAPILVLIFSFIAFLFVKFYRCMCRFVIHRLIHHPT